MLFMVPLFNRRFGILLRTVFLRALSTEVTFRNSRLHQPKSRYALSGRSFDIATAFTRAMQTVAAGLPYSDEQKKTRLRSHLSA
jgi:hypothetical protein